MSDSSNSTSSGIGASTVLGLIFITLKLLGKISWSWWWVTCPFWAIPIVLIAVLLIIWLIALIAWCVGKTRK